MTAAAAQAEFDAIYQQTRATVLSVGYQMTGDATLAEDVLQETFLLVHRYLPQFRGEADVGTWVYRMAVRVALRMRQTRTVRSHEILSPETPAANDGGALELSAHIDERRRLYAALDRLSDEHRTVISLLSIRDIPAAQVAAILGVPEGTVWSRAHQARKQLRQLLAKET